MFLKSRSPDLLLKFLRNQAVPRQHVERADLAGLVVGCDVDDCDALAVQPSRSPSCSAWCFVRASTRWAGTKRLRCVLNGWRKKVSTLAMA